MVANATARIVLVRLSALGDIVHTWPLAEALKRHLPESRLMWVVEEQLAAMVEGHPAVDEVLTVSTRRWRRRPLASGSRKEMTRVRATLRGFQPTHCLDPQGVAKSALVSWWSGAPERTGLARPWRRELLAGAAYTRTLAIDPGALHIIRTNLEFLRVFGCEPPRAPVPPNGRWLARRCQGPGGPGLATPGQYAVLLPGAGRSFKLIPTTTLVEVARRLAAHGLGVVVAWGPGERMRAAEVVGGGGQGVELCPPTDLEQLVGILAAAAVVIGGDTGPVHLAASLGTPTVAVFTATDPVRNAPLGERVSMLATAGRRPPTATGSAAVAAGPPPPPAVIAEAAIGLLSGNSSVVGPVC
ncbi:MAG: lipopolysaccharide heptosyltransferase I [Acidobacteria bacterium]|nr:lipopolysaccharide heptosyltransferase I [Acidobacteriota bacterium]